MARNGSGLYLRNGYWAFRYRDASGKWREKSTGKTKAREASREKENFLASLENGTLPGEMAAWTLRQAADSWLELRSALKPGRTSEGEKRFLKQVLNVLGDQRLLQSLKPHDLEQYQATRLKGTATRKPVGPRTINYELFCLRQLLKRAGLWSRFRDHYRQLPIPKTGPGVAITAEDAEKLFRAAMSKPAWKVAFCAALLAYSTGMRGGEIRCLQLGDIDLKAKVPIIRIRPEATKSRRAREIPLNDTAQWCLRQLTDRACLLGSTEPNNYLLPLNRSHHNRPDDPRRGSRGYDPLYHQSSWVSAWTALRKSAGLPKFRFHDLRHSFVTAGAEAKVPLLVMQSIVGHMSPEMTIYYTHISERSKQQAVEAIEGATGRILAGLITPAEPAKAAATADRHAARSCVSRRRGIRSANGGATAGRIA